MIQASFINTPTITEKKAPWQMAMINAIRDPAILIQRLQLDLKYLEPAYKAARLFPLRVTESFLSRIEKNNPHDPLLKQILPLDLEYEEIKGYTKDPLQEKNFNPIPGLLHKYKNRVLITLTSSCGIHCRYCFRREFPYEENKVSKNQWEKIKNYVMERKEINEIILSGGDPLMVPDNILSSFLNYLSSVPHLKTVRIHTRMPIVLPERITENFLQIMSSLPFKKIMVLHTNHPNEINHDVISRCEKLAKHQIILLNQSVLLKDINDDAEVLIKLSYKLFEAGVMPYYLHLPDKVKGTAHFDVSDKTAKNIMLQMQAALSGYLVPKLVREIPGEKNKTYII